MHVRELELPICGGGDACFDRVYSEIYDQLQNTSSLLRAKKNFRNISLSNVLVHVHFSAFPRLRLCFALKW